MSESPALAEQALLQERRAIATWLADLEKRLTDGERLYERVLQLRRIVGKLDGRIRIIRELEKARNHRPQAADHPEA